MSTHNKLREWRNKNEVTQSELARRTGLSLYAIHRIETGKTSRIDLRDARSIVQATQNAIQPFDLLME